MSVLVLRPARDHSPEDFLEADGLLADVVTDDDDDDQDDGLLALTPFEPVHFKRGATVEIVTPVARVSIGDTLCSVRDLKTKRLVKTRSKGFVLLGTLLCAKFDAIGTFGDDYLIQGEQGRIACVRIAEGTDLKVAI